MIIQKKVQDKLYSPKFKLHLTLIGLYENVDILFFDKLKSFLQGRKSITLSTNNYEYLDEFYRSFFISIEKSKELKRLRDDLYYLYPCGLNVNFKPHVSLSYGNHSKREKEKIVSSIGKPPKYILMDKVSIVNIDEIKNKWEVLKSINLF